MKKSIKAILIILGILLIGYIMFMVEESVRLQNDYKAEPLIVIDKVMCSKDSYACYGKNGEYEEKYTSLGFVLKRSYVLDEYATAESHSYHIVSSEFWLFNKYMLWGWII